MSALRYPATFYACNAISSDVSSQDVLEIARGLRTLASGRARAVVQSRRASTGGTAGNRFASGWCDVAYVGCVLGGEAPVVFVGMLTGGSRRMAAVFRCTSLRSNSGFVSCELLVDPVLNRDGSFVDRV